MEFIEYFEEYKKLTKQSISLSSEVVDFKIIFSALLSGAKLDYNFSNTNVNTELANCFSRYLFDENAGVTFERLLDFNNTPVLVTSVAGKLIGLGMMSINKETINFTEIRRDIILNKVEMGVMEEVPIVTVTRVSSLTDSIQELILDYERSYKKVLRVQDLVISGDRIGIIKDKINYKVDVRFPMGQFEDLNDYHSEVMDIKSDMDIIIPCFSDKFLELIKIKLSNSLERHVVSATHRIKEYLYLYGNFESSNRLINSFDEKYFRLKYRGQFDFLKSFLNKNINARYSRKFEIMNEFGGLDKELILEFTDFYETIS